VLSAKTPDEVDEAVRRLTKEGIKRIQISKEPYHGKIKEEEDGLIDLKSLEGPSDDARK